MSDQPVRHELFEPFAGVFRAEVRLYLGPGEPHISTGTMTNQFVLGERFLQQIYQGDAVEGPFGEFAGIGYWGYDPSSNQYQGFWIDTASSIMQHEVGTVDDSGTVWTMIGEFTHPETGQTIRKRSVITLIDNQEHKLESYFPGPDGKEHLSMEILYARRE